MGTLKLALAGAAAAVALMTFDSLLTSQPAQRAAQSVERAGKSGRLDTSFPSARESTTRIKTDHAHGVTIVERKIETARATGTLVASRTR